MYACVNHLCRAHLQREKQAREDAERREKELHDRLQRFQDEAKAAQEGMYRRYIYQYYSWFAFTVQLN